MDRVINHPPMNSWTSRILIYAAAGLVLVGIASLFIRTNFASVRFDRSFALGIRRFEVTGCNRTNYYTVHDFGWLHLTRVEPGGVLPGMASTSREPAH